MRFTQTELAAELARALGAEVGDLPKRGEVARP